MRFLLSFLVIFQLITSTVFAGLPPTTVKGQSDASPSTTFGIQVPFSQATRIDGTTALLETGNGNLLKNPGFEHTTYSTGWTASGGTSAVGTTTNIGFGAKSYTWDSNAAGQTLTSDAITVPEALKGKNGEASVRIKVPSGTATHKLQAYDGTNVLSETTITSSTSFAETRINFVFPASGSIYFRLISVAADEPLIAIDDSYLGSARNIGTVAQARMIGALRPINCNYSGTPGITPVDLTGTGCTYGTAYGDAQAPSGNLQGIKFANLPAGEYFITVINGSFGSAMTTGTEPQFRWSDGTNTAPTRYCGRDQGAEYQCPAPVARFVYTTPQSNITFRIQGWNTNAAHTLVSQPGEIVVYYYPTTSDQVARTDLSAISWSGYVTGFWSTTSTSYVDVSTAGSPSITQLANRNFGTVTQYNSGGNIYPGITVTPPKTGNYLVCFNAALTNNTANAQAFMKLVDGSGASIVHDIAWVNTASTASTTPSLGGCGIWLVATPGVAQNLRLQLRVVGASTGYIGNGAANVNFSIAHIDTSLPAPLLVNTVVAPDYNGVTRINTFKAVSANYTLTENDETLMVYASSAAITVTLPDAAAFKGKKFTIGKGDGTTWAINLATTSSQQINFNTASSYVLRLPMDKITLQSDGTLWHTVDGSNVTSAGYFSERIGRAKITGSTGAIAKQNGSWISGASRSATGTYVFTFATGTFSDVPSCFCLTEYDGVGGSYCAYASTISATGMTIKTYNSSNADADRNFTLTCVGPR